MMMMMMMMMMMIHDDPAVTEQFQLHFIFWLSSWTFEADQSQQ